MNPKLKAILAAVAWAALVAVLQAIDPMVPAQFHGFIAFLIAFLTGAAKYSPQSAVVMRPPAQRAADGLMGDRRVIEPQSATDYKGKGSLS